MAQAPTFRVNFSRPMPLFPLESVVLLPQQAVPLHIFEPQYRAMVSDVLDGSGQFAMAMFDTNTAGEVRLDENDLPMLRPSVCVAQVAEHESLPDGRFNIVVQGICRARIVDETSADLAIDRAYRTALLTPLMNQDDGGPGLEALREWVSDELEHGPLKQLSAATSVLGYLQNKDIPSAAVLELVGFALTTDPEVRYRLLDEPSVAVRAEVIRGELGELGRMLELSGLQRGVPWPKGCSWN